MVVLLIVAIVGLALFGLGFYSRQLTGRAGLDRSQQNLDAERRMAELRTEAQMRMNGGNQNYGGGSFGP